MLGKDAPGLGDRFLPQLDVFFHNRSEIVHIVEKDPRLVTHRWVDVPRNRDVDH